MTKRVQVWSLGPLSHNHKSINNSQAVEKYFTKMLLYKAIKLFFQKSESESSLSLKIKSKLEFYGSILTGLVLMFFIQFGGYNVSSLFAAKILQMDMSKIHR